MRILCSLFMLMFLVGCVSSKIIEDIQLVQINGYDLTAQEQMIRGTISIPQYGSSEQANEVNNIEYHAESQTAQDIRTKIEAETPYPVESGKTLGVLFGRGLAEKGIGKLIEGLSENQDFGRNLFLCVVDGKAETLLTQEFETQDTIAKYVVDLIQTNQEKNFPKTNFHELLYSFHGEGMDFFLPFLSHTDKDVKVSGLALFKEDKLVDTIPFKEVFIFKALYENSDDANYQFFWAEKDTYLTIKSISSNVKVKQLKDNKMSITINMIGIITETLSLNIDQLNEVKKLERALAVDISTKGQALIKKLQEQDIDPLRLGDYARSQTRNWDYQAWQTSYPNMEIKVNTNFKISQSNIGK
ncbi:Ger(x)C family spore germination protein [Aquibacillus koreensis]|uniref:Ger(X)C family spore germination protein n=1 Tax=Aquibacillus koreensis TaxID=279446 RepID=A0A9X3WKF8_9BACI|nr:Ger(x)C family spore germination protein [Aquibacillus koreensis]MCT2537086.1 Ger(x)C family spore germination protein [Aquibacillus koreensis]MDC3419931.1 Ger(x)C family spore germination protein [Aquibacillus koreensis]